jgi:hypothetical protein
MAWLQPQLIDPPMISDEIGETTRPGKFFAFTDDRRASLASSMRAITLPRAAISSSGVAGGYFRLGHDHSLVSMTGEVIDAISETTSGE